MRLGRGVVWPAVVVVAALAGAWGGLLVAESGSAEVEAEADRLLRALSAEEVHPIVLEGGFKEFSAESKNAAVARVARTFRPPPPGRLVARLMFIRTEANSADLRAVYVANLRSPDPEARKWSLFNLSKLGHPAVLDFATEALRDEADSVLFIACELLLKARKDDPCVRALLRGVYLAHESEGAWFQMTLGILRHHGFDRASEHSK